MPRQRMIRPEIWTDEGFLSLTIPARLLFIGMISGADDEGRGLATDRCLKASVFPGDDMTLEDIRGYRDELGATVNVRFYEVDGKEYYQLTKWNNHQKVDHAKVSTYPIPEDAGTTPVPVPDAARQLTNELVNESININVCFEEFWKAYPRKVNKAGALKAWKARMKEKKLVVSDVMVAVANYTKSVSGKELQFVMHPTTFIGPSLRWNDYLVTGSKYVPAAKVDDDLAWICGECGAKYRSTSTVCVKCGWRRE